jgi:hypothetical protein
VEEASQHGGGFKRQVHRATRGRIGRWLERLTRFGYATRGLVFALVGLGAMRAAYGIGRATGTRGVMREMGRQPFGRTLLIVTTVGMSSYVLWRFVQAALDPFMEGDGPQANIRRIGYFGSGLFYALLALTAGQLAFNFAEMQNARREMTAWVLEKPFGPWMIGLVGVVLIGVGAHALWRAATASFMKLYPPPRPHTGGRRRRLAKRVGQLGLSALGLVLCLIGGLVVLAATEANPERAVGIGGALHWLRQGTYGVLMLGVAGVGFVFYGLHCAVLGAYRRVRPGEEGRVVQEEERKETVAREQRK